MTSAKSGESRTVASDGTNAYFGGTMMHVRAVTAAGGSPTNVAPRNTDSPVNQIVLDGSYIWWAEHNILSGGTSYVRRIAKSGGMVELRASSKDGASDLAAVGDRAYYIAPFGTSKSSGAIHMAPAGSGMVGVDADTSHVYFLEGNVKRIPLAGGKAEPIAVMAARCLDLVIDADYVYFIEGMSVPMACGGNGFDRSCDLARTEREAGGQCVDAFVGDRRWRERAPQPASLLRRRRSQRPRCRQAGAQVIGDRAEERTLSSAVMAGRSSKSAPSRRYSRVSLASGGSLAGKNAVIR